MAAFHYPIAIAATPGGPFETLEALVDTGATYTWVPRSVLQRLGVQPTRRASFVLANGQEVEYDMGEVRMRLDGQELYTPCIFGDDGTDPLLGAVTLEEFGLGVDPVNRRLIPVRLYLA